MNLLISPHMYWETFPTGDYVTEFDDVFWFGRRPGYGSVLCGSLLQVYGILCIKRQLARIAIGDDDVVIGLSSSTFVENAVLSCTRKNRRIAIIPFAAYSELASRPDWSRFRFTGAGWVSRYAIQPLTGLEPTLRLTRQRWVGDGFDGNYFERFEREIEDVYDRTVVLVNLYDTSRLSDLKTLSMPFPYVLDRSRKQPEASERTERQVVFFGTAFIEKGHQPIGAELFAKRLNQCLSYLRRVYTGSHKLVYRPHPGETETEWKLLDLSRFEVQTDRQMAELYLADHRSSTDAVFSVSSTASRSGVNCGINSYVFFELFGFDDISSRYFRIHLGNQPDAFYIRDLSTPPAEYQDPCRLDQARVAIQTTMDSILG